MVINLHWDQSNLQLDPDIFSLCNSFGSLQVDNTSRCLANTLIWFSCSPCKFTNQRARNDYKLVKVILCYPSCVMAMIAWLIVLFLLFRETVTTSAVCVVCDCKESDVGLASPRETVWHSDVQIVDEGWRYSPEKVCLEKRNFLVCEYVCCLTADFILS